MKTKSKPVSPNVFHAWEDLAELNSYHGVNLKSWGTVVEDTTEDDEMYEAYLEWYSRTFTKLGRVLE